MRTGFAMRGLWAILAFSAVAGYAHNGIAGETWDLLKPDVYGDRPIGDGAGIITLAAPARPEDQSNVPVSAEVVAPAGRTIQRVTFIVDENPSPVAADFEIGQGRAHVSLGAKFRFNQATDVRVVVEDSAGQLYMTSRHVKFAGGQAACAAPPTGDPAEIAARMGTMTLANSGAAKPAASVSSMYRSAEIEVSHPNHTGMVLDQITLLYIPLRIVTDMVVDQGDERIFAMHGSMTLSQNPAITFDYRPNGAAEVHATVRDSSGTAWEKSFPVGPAS